MIGGVQNKESQNHKLGDGRIRGSSLLLRPEENVLP